ncbi:MAG: helix-turn-helix transcriptional regulator [Saprospiraceae bacterium]|nr:helix-turn-helix transcriptional regulator [Saprospiraceae bacterium]
MSEQIKIARLEKNVSQSDLASRLNISKATLSRIENGQTLPNQKIVGKIQAELGTKLTFNGY